MKRFLRSRFFFDYGSVFVLLILCAYYSVVTLAERHPMTPAAGRDLARTIAAAYGSDARVLIVVRDTQEHLAFAAAVQSELEAAGAAVLETVAGRAAQVKTALDRLAESGSRLDVIATNQATLTLTGPLGKKDLEERFSGRAPAVHVPASYTWPTFLTPENLINVINQNADIAIIAIGMTMVIITAGIDLSVGSLLALAAVITAVTIQRFAGGADASLIGLAACSTFGVVAVALCGAFSGVMVTVFRVPAFVVTLAFLMIARGLALIIAVDYQSELLGGATAATPEAVKIEAAGFAWLGSGELLGVPNPIVLMVLLYIVAHVVMTRTSFGRYVYAVGGNPEAARLSGVPVVAVIIAVYAICAAMAGLGGVVDASRFEGGRPSAGELYELQVIAAVVVGGTSLAGGEGRVFGTLIGAMIIAVIQNGLNMDGVESYTQKVVFGLLILGAVLLDQIKKKLRGA